MKKGSLKGRLSAVLLPSLISLLAALSPACTDAASEAKADALELEEVFAYWAVRGKDREQNNYIHPVVRFRIRNTGTEEAGYIQAMAVFKRENLPDEPWGNDFLYSISKTPLAPGAPSGVVTMRSDTNFVSKDAPEQMFQSEKWEKVSVSVFLRVGPSSWKPVLSLEVPKQIGAPGLQKFLEPEGGIETTPPRPEPGVGPVLNILNLLVVLERGLWYGESSDGRLGENIMAHQELSQASIGVPEKGASVLTKERRQTPLEVGSDLNAGAEMKVGERIREVRKSKRIRQKVLARMVGISPGALTNFEKGRRRISLDWLQKIAEALDTPVSYFLPDEKDRSRTTPGDPRERRLLTAWRQMGQKGKSDVLRGDFLQLLEHLGRAKGVRKAKRRVS